LRLRSAQPSKSQKSRSRFHWQHAQKQPTRNTVAKKQAGQEDLESIYLLIELIARPRVGSGLPPHNPSELGAGVAPTSTKLFSGIAKPQAKLLKSDRPGGSCEGKSGGPSTGQSLFLIRVSGSLLVIFKEYTGSINSAVFTWKNDRKLEVAQHIADYEIGHSARKKLANCSLSRRGQMGASTPSESTAGSGIDASVFTQKFKSLCTFEFIFIFSKK
jgi:hypothetical protein